MKLADYKKRSAHKGTASTELIIGCLAAIPLFYGVSLLGKYADIRHKAVESARYIAWEQVIWPKGREKSINNLTLEATDRFTGHRRAPVVDVSKVGSLGATQESLWRDHQSRTLLVADGTTANVNTSKQQANTPQHIQLVKYHADKLISNNRKDFNITTHRIQMPITDRVKNPKAQKRSTIAAFFDTNNYEINKALNLEATAGILSDTWAANSESQFNEQIQRLVPTTGTVKLLVSPLGAVATLGGELFPEAEYGREIDFIPPSSAILDQYIVIE